MGYLLGEFCTKFTALYRHRTIYPMPLGECNTDNYEYNDYNSIHVHIIWWCQHLNNCQFSNSHTRHPVARISLLESFKGNGRTNLVVWCIAIFIIVVIHTLPSDIHDKKNNLTDFINWFIPMLKNLLYLRISHMYGDLALYPDGTKPLHEPMPLSSKWKSPEGQFYTSVNIID